MARLFTYIFLEKVFSEYEIGTHVQLSSSLFKMCEPISPHVTNVDIIFFHGLQFEHNSDGYLSTWRSRDTLQEVWPARWLPVKYPDARITAVSYDASVATGSTEGRSDMHVIGENLLQEILWFRGNQGRECPIILVGHSFGGLVMKQLCMQAHKTKENSMNGADIRRFLDSTRGLFFYGTPHRGVNAAVWEDLVLNSGPENQPLLSYMGPLGKNAARLHEEFEQRREEYGWLIYGVGELHACETQCDSLVPEASSRYGSYIQIDCDHFSICRPVSTTCNGYLHLVDLIKDVKDEKRQDERRKQEKLFQNLVGGEPLLAKVQELLKTNAFLGLCGMGDVGKTILARLVFNSTSSMFEYTCFMAEMKRRQGNKEEMKKQIWRNMHRHGLFVSKKISRNMLAEVSGKKLLIVLDDIDSHEHIELLEEIARENDSMESRFITTSRDVELLGLLGETYMIRALEHGLARKLFFTYAFPRGKEPLEHLKHYVEKVVEGCAGLPLTLKVLGKYLHDKTDEKFWVDAVSFEFWVRCSEKWRRTSHFREAHVENTMIEL